LLPTDAEPRGNAVATRLASQTGSIAESAVPWGRGSRMVVPLVKIPVLTPR